ncbi:MAG: UDP-N-acetylglucosamine 2-epimerase [Bacteroidales bacterium]|jgi:UDP-N-acetylglucosamine 2-epimerase (non-hydrolysing)/GDP/UDP-N,N'-diacetylbacillosamine 2-epimerase (hydrolysing)|nr:UDP-N-acetylglucosamine 2-epimerase [Bacteroidales bacterium]
MRKICVVTGSRAEYGILRGLLAAIKNDPELILQIIATNQHLSKLQGETYKEIEQDGFTIRYKVYMADDKAPDNANSIAKSIGRGVSGFADAFDILRPDLLLILGDRYEMLAVVSTALIYKIPIAHLHGGEITEGAFDDAIRHAITKMSHLHFTSTEAYRKRVIQLGEQPERVFNVGALGVENVINNEFMSKEEIEQSLNFQLTDKCFLCTYHPVTLSDISSEEQVFNLLEALDNYNDYHIIFTYSNSDTNSQIIIKRIQEYVDKNPERCMSIPSLGQIRYFSVLKYMKAVIGNSSSGIVEVPSFGIPTLDVGDRQKGRIAPDSVIHCGYSIAEINEGLKKVLEYKTVLEPIERNLYHKPGTCDAILKILKTYPLRNIVQKHFYDID